MTSILCNNNITSQALILIVYSEQCNLGSDLLSILQLYFNLRALGSFLQTNPKSLSHLIIPILLWYFFPLHVCWLVKNLRVNNGFVLFQSLHHFYSFICNNATGHCLQHHNYLKGSQLWCHKKQWCLWQAVWRGQGRQTLNRILVWVFMYLWPDDRKMIQVQDNCISQSHQQFYTKDKQIKGIDTYIKRWSIWTSLYWARPLII